MVRFPTIVMNREDKDSSCCTSFEEYDQIRSDCDGKITKQHLDANGDTVIDRNTRKRKRAGPRTRRVAVAPAFRQPDDLHLERVDR